MIELILFMIQWFEFCVIITCLNIYLIIHYSMYKFLHDIMIHLDVDNCLKYERQDKLILRFYIRYDNCECILSTFHI